MNKVILITALPLLLVGCASNPPSVTSKPIIEADSKIIAPCNFVGTFVGRSFWGGLASSYSEQKSLASAKAQASAKGATHYVMGAVDPANFQKGSWVSIKGYICK